MNTIKNRLESARTLENGHFSRNRRRLSKFGHESRTDENLDLNVSIFYSFFFATDGLSILPLAALLTGTMLTIGIAVLLIVVLAIRKRRDNVSRNICDDKDKHLGTLRFMQIFRYFVRFLNSIFFSRKEWT